MDYMDCIGVVDVEMSKQLFSNISSETEELLQTKYEEFEKNIKLNIEKIRSNKEKSFIFQEKQMNRIGIENIKKSRINRLQKDKEIWDTTFKSASQIVPSLTCLLMIKA